MLEDVVKLGERERFNTVTLRRTWNPNPNQQNIAESAGNVLADAILYNIALLANNPSLLVLNSAQMLSVYTDKAIQMTKDISVRVSNVVSDGSGFVMSVTLTLISETFTASEIGHWIREQRDNYLDAQGNFGETLYYFENKPPKAKGDPRGHPGTEEEAKMMRIITAPKFLTYSQYTFHSNKTFKNIYGDNAHLVEKRVNFFLNNREWYREKGISYQLGLMLSGIPGSGKTSIIRAIANVSKRHIISVNCANIQTATQFKNLFFNENLAIQDENGDIKTVRVPLHKRIYVLEEIDAMGEIVRRRTSKITKATLPDELTLAEILTTFDGTLEIPGRIMVITSNYPEHLDEALLRPGRVDLNVKFGFASKSLIVEMFEAFFDQPFPQDLVESIPEGVLSPAETSEIFFRHFTGDPVNPNDVLVSLIEASRSKV